MHRSVSWLEENLDQAHSVEDIARRAKTSVRSLNRHFKAQTGVTPLQWLLTTRVRRAQVLLETTSYSVEQIATEVGFGSVTALRDHFKRAARTSPNAYRRSFRTRARG